MILISPHLTSAAGCSSKPEVSDEDKKRQAVRAQLEKIQQEYQDAQQQARSAQQQLKCVSVFNIFAIVMHEQNMQALACNFCKESEAATCTDKVLLQSFSNAPPRRPYGVDVASTSVFFAEGLSACRDFEKEASQKQREARPVLDRVNLAEETVKAAEDQVKRAEGYARSADEQLRAAVDQLRSAVACLSHPA